LELEQEIPLSIFEDESQELWLRGSLEFDGAGCLEVNFNEEFKGWKYKWRSHRYVSDILHCFRVYACSLNSPSSATICDIFSSPSFALHSRMKRGLKTHKKTDERIELPGNNRKRSREDKIDEIMDSEVLGYNRKRASDEPIGTKKFDEKSVFETGNMGYTPNEPMISEHIENRTLDRIHNLFETGWSSQDKFKLATVLTVKVLRTLERVFELCVTIVGSHSVLNSIAHHWLNRREEFSRAYMEELKFNKDSMYLLDTTYNAGEESPCIFREIRQVHRNNMKVVLAMESISVVSMYAPMKAASLAGLIPLDPCHPPTASTASRVFSRLNGDAAPFDPSIYSAGLTTFNSVSEFCTYARDLFQFRRLCHQSIIISLMERLLSSQQNDQDSICSPLNGSWVNGSLGETSEFKLVQIPGVLGALLGPFVAAMVLRSFSRMDVEIKNQNIILSGPDGARLDFRIDSQPVSSF